jgi:hypothetical protein
LRLFGIVFLYSLSICPLLVYSKSTEFCKLILYPTNLLKLLMMSKSFLVEFFRSFRYKITWSVNRDSLISSLPTYIPFISSSCLIGLARNSKTMLNRSGESEQPCLIPDFRENGFSFSPLSLVVGYGFVIYNLYYVEVHSFITNFIRAFIMKECWILLKDFSASAKMRWSMVLVFASVNMLHYI